MIILKEKDNAFIKEKNAIELDKTKNIDKINENILNNNMKFEENTNKLKNDFAEKKQQFLNDQELKNFKNEIEARKKIMELDFQKQQQEQMIQMMMQQMMFNNQFNQFNQFNQSNS